MRLFLFFILISGNLNANSRSDQNKTKAKIKGGAITTTRKGGNTINDIGSPKSDKKSTLPVKKNWRSEIINSIKSIEH